MLPVDLPAMPATMAALPMVPALCAKYVGNRFVPMQGGSISVDAAPTAAGNATRARATPISVGSSTDTDESAKGSAAGGRNKNAESSVSRVQPVLKRSTASEPPAQGLTCARLPLPLPVSAIHCSIPFDSVTAPAQLVGPEFFLRGAFDIAKVAQGRCKLKWAGPANDAQFRTLVNSCALSTPASSPTGSLAPTHDENAALESFASLCKLTPQLLRKWLNGEINSSPNHTSMRLAMGQLLVRSPEVDPEKRVGFLRLVAWADEMQQRLHTPLEAALTTMLVARSQLRGATIAAATLPVHDTSVGIPPSVAAPLPQPEPAITVSAFSANVTDAFQALFGSSSNSDSTITAAEALAVWPMKGAKCPCRPAGAAQLTDGTLQRLTLLTLGRLKWRGVQSKRFPPRPSTGERAFLAALMARAPVGSPTLQAMLQAVPVAPVLFNKWITGVVSGSPNSHIARLALVWLATTGRVSTAAFNAWVRVEQPVATFASNSGESSTAVATAQKKHSSDVSPALPPQLQNKRQKPNGREHGNAVSSRSDDDDSDESTRDDDETSSNGSFVGVSSWEALSIIRSVSSDESSSDEIDEYVVSGQITRGRRIDLRAVARRIHHAAALVEAAAMDAAKASHVRYSPAADRASSATSGRDVVSHLRRVISAGGQAAVAKAPAAVCLSVSPVAAPSIVALEDVAAQLALPPHRVAMLYRFLTRDIRLLHALRMTSRELFGQSVGYVVGDKATSQGQKNDVMGVVQRESLAPGQTHPKVLERIRSITCLGPGDLFVDVGHGEGFAALGMALTSGCSVLGIEVVASRVASSERLYNELMHSVAHPPIAEANDRAGAPPEPPCCSNRVSSEICEGGLLLQAMGYDRSTQEVMRKALSAAAAVATATAAAASSSSGGSTRAGAAPTTAVSSTIADDAVATCTSVAPTLGAPSAVGGNSGVASASAVPAASFSASRSGASLLNGEAATSSSSAAAAAVDARSSEFRPPPSHALNMASWAEFMATITTMLPPPSGAPALSSAAAATTSSGAAERREDPRRRNSSVAHRPPGSAIGCLRCAAAALGSPQSLLRNSKVSSCPQQDLAARQEHSQQSVLACADVNRPANGLFARVPRRPEWEHDGKADYKAAFVLAASMTAAVPGMQVSSEAPCSVRPSAPPPSFRNHAHFPPQRPATIVHRVVAV